MKCFKCKKSCRKVEDIYGYNYYCCDYRIFCFKILNDFGFLQINIYYINKFGAIFSDSGLVLDLNFEIKDPEKAYNLLNKFIKNLEFA